MAFQDFDLISDRRKTEQRQKFKKKILIGVTSVILLACVIAAATFAVVKRTGPDANTKELTPLPKATEQVLDQHSKLAKMLCSSALYREKCESTINEALKNDPNLAEPKDLLMVSMLLAEAEVSKAFNKTSGLKFKSEEEKGAYEDCKQLFDDAKEELELSITAVGASDTSALASKASELNNWLSAVMSYQQTCIDGFPEGETKEELETNFKESRELISNSLAVVSQVSTFFSIFKGAGGMHLPKWGGNNDNNDDNDNDNANVNDGGAPPPTSFDYPASFGANSGIAAPPGSASGYDPSAFGFGPLGTNPDIAAAAAPGSGSAPSPVPSWAGPMPTTGGPIPAFGRPIPSWGGPIPTWPGPSDLMGSDEKPTPNVTVAIDGSGDFKTISEALAAIPKTYEGRYVVYVKEGVYDETVTVGKKMPNVFMYGDGMRKSIITGNKNYVDKVRTFQTASFVVLGEGFVCKDMGFRNTAGPEKHQAVAARIQADRAVFRDCAFDGYQDTLYAQTHRQFYRDCIISGTIDFIFGDARAVFQNCTMVIRKPLENQQNIVTAQGRMDKQENSGFVLQKCVITADEQLVPLKGKIRNYLGRPWKEYSRTIIMETEIGDLIHPDGWLPWEADFALKTLYYGEYGNTGPGAPTNARVNWSTRKDIDRNEAMRYTVEAFLEGSWINGTGVPAHLGLYN